MDIKSLKKLFLIVFSLFIVIIGFSQTFLDKAEVYYFNGKSAFQTGDYKSAERFFEEALNLTAEIEIRYPDIRYMLGWTKFYLKKYDEAQKYLKYYADDPKTLLALKSMSEGNIQEELHFKSVKIKPTLPSTEATSNDNIKIGLVYYIIVAFVILFIVAVLAFLMYFFVLKRYSFTNKTENTMSDVEEMSVEEEGEEEEISIPVEEILEVKIDELEELWEEYEKMKKKMDIDESEIEEMPEKTENQVISSQSPPQNLKPEEINLEELDVNELLEETEKIEVDDEKKDNLDNTNDNNTENINMDIEDVENIPEEFVESETKKEMAETKEDIEDENEESNNIEEFIEKDKISNLDDIETVKPPIDVITKYNKIMAEPQGSIVVSNIKGVESLEKLDEEVLKKGGQFTKGDLHNIFKEIFAEKNRDSLMIE